MKLGDISAGIADRKFPCRFGADQRPIYVDGEVNAIRGEDGFSDDSPVYVKIGTSNVGSRLIDRFVCSRDHPPPKLVSVCKGYGRVGEACGGCSSQRHSIVSLLRASTAHHSLGTKCPY
jgi:hypothetical protein